MEDPLPCLRLAGDATAASHPPHLTHPPYSTIAHHIHSAAASLLSLFPVPSSPKPAIKLSPNPISNINSHEPSTSSVLVPFPCQSRRALPGRGSSSAMASSLGGISTKMGVDATGVGGEGIARGPGFIGQVFSMCDSSGIGLTEDKSGFDVSFLSKRVPGWVNNTFKLNKHENPRPLRFFFDLNDAVAYVRCSKIPSGLIGSCSLHVAYRHFKENPHMYKFVPNTKQVKEANKILKSNLRSGAKRLEGVPVFSAQNLNVAMATNNGIKWYTPYFFDKNTLDNILEASFDQHFDLLIQNRHDQRWRDIVDDGPGADIFEETGDSFLEPPEVQEVLDEMGLPGIPLGVISKVVEFKFLDLVDKVILGNRWLRKVTRIQPKFPYLVDSFEARSAASYVKDKEPTRSFPGSGNNNHNSEESHSSRETGSSGQVILNKGNGGLRIPLSDWFPNPWLKPPEESKYDETSKRFQATDDNGAQKQENVHLPKITMVGVSSMKEGKVSKTSLMKTVDKLFRELEQSKQVAEELDKEKDPLFFANIGDYSTLTSMRSL